MLFLFIPLTPIVVMTSAVLNYKFAVWQLGIGGLLFLSFSILLAATIIDLINKYRDNKVTRIAKLVAPVEVTVETIKGQSIYTLLAADKKLLVLPELVEI